MQFPILVFDRACQLIRFNAPAERRFDLRPSALLQHVSRLRLPLLLDDLETRFGRVLAHNGVGEEALIKQDDRTLRLNVTPGVGKSGEVVTLVVSLIDVTDLVEARNALAQSQSRLSSLMEHTTMIFAMKDITGKYTYANRSFLNFFGIDDKDCASKNDFNLLPPTLTADFWELDMQALRTRSRYMANTPSSIGIPNAICVAFTRCCSMSMGSRMLLLWRRKI